jgi:hypothetical protein
MCHFFPPKRKNLLYRLEGPIFFFCPQHAKFCQKQKQVANSSVRQFSQIGYKQDMNSKKNNHPLHFSLKAGSTIEKSDDFFHK